MIKNKSKTGTRLNETLRQILKVLFYTYNLSSVWPTQLIVHAVEKDFEATVM